MWLCPSETYGDESESISLEAASEKVADEMAINFWVEIRWCDNICRDLGSGR